MADKLTSPAITNRERKRRERAAQKTLRKLIRQENVYRKRESVLNREPYKPLVRGERWTPVPETEGAYEVNQRGQIRRRATP